MVVFKIQENKVIRLDPVSKFKKEKELEDFFENNLQQLLGFRFLERQYRIRGGKEIIDILAIDGDNSPVIIELKLDKGGDDILAQGKSYSGWLHENKMSFEHLVENKLGKGIKVSWELPRVIFIAQRFSERLEGVVKRDEEIELIRYAFNGQDTLVLSGEELFPGFTLKDKSNKKLSAGDVVKHFYKFEEDFAIITSDEVRSKIITLRDKVIKLDGVTEDPRQTGVAYKAKDKFMRFEFRPTWVQLLLKKPSYANDSKKIIKDITDNNWGYSGKIKFDIDSDVDYIFQIILEAYNQAR